MNKTALIEFAKFTGKTVAALAAYGLFKKFVGPKLPAAIAQYLP